MNPNVIEFVGDDAGYLKWLREHPSGYILNAEKSKNPNSLVLHRAGCYHVTGYNRDYVPGEFTERTQIKICAPDAESLRYWVRQHGRSDGSYISERCYCLN